MELKDIAITLGIIGFGILSYLHYNQNITLKEESHFKNQNTVLKREMSSFKDQNKQVALKIDKLGKEINEIKKKNKELRKRLGEKVDKVLVEIEEEYKEFTEYMPDPEKIKKELDTINKRIATALGADYDWKLPTVLEDDYKYLSDVITIKEFKEDPKKFFHRLDTSVSNFLLEITYDYELTKLFIGYSKISGGYFIDTNSEVVIHTHRHNLNDLEEILYSKDLDSSDQRGRISLDQISFLKNYRAIYNFIQNKTNISLEEKGECIRRLTKLKIAVAKVLEFKYNCSVESLKTIDETRLLDNGVKTIKSVYREYGEPDAFYEYLINNSEGFTKNDIQEILRIRNNEEFVKLGLQRTKELMKENKEDSNIKDIVSMLTPLDSIVLASYFARACIQEYSSDDMQVKQKSQGIFNWSITGDCKDFAGLTIQYLNRVVKPVNPNLKNWYFGLEIGQVGKWGHAYVVAVHLLGKNYPDQQVKTYFFDPTELANYNLMNLDREKIIDVADATNDNYHFLKIKRYGEDFVKFAIKIPDYKEPKLKIRE